VTARVARNIGLVRGARAQPLYNLRGCFTKDLPDVRVNSFVIR